MRKKFNVGDVIVLNSKENIEILEQMKPHGYCLPHTYKIIAETKTEYILKYYCKDNFRGDPELSGKYKYGFTTKVFPQWNKKGFAETAIIIRKSLINMHAETVEEFTKRMKEDTLALYLIYAPLCKNEEEDEEDDELDYSFLYEPDEIDLLSERVQKEKIKYFEFKTNKNEIYCVGKRDLIYTKEDRKFDKCVPSGIYIKKKDQVIRSKDDRAFLGLETWEEMLEYIRVYFEELIEESIIK